MAEQLAGYVDVATRVARFYEKYPDGTLAAELIEDDGQRVLMRALAYRNPNDAKPGVGHAEEVRGSSPVNKTSALENCETSAWGRALASLGFEIKGGIASRQEVQQARAQQGRDQAARKISPAQIEKFILPLKRRMKITDASFAQLLAQQFGVDRIEDLPIIAVDALGNALTNPQTFAQDAPDV